MLLTLISSAMQSTNSAMTRKIDNFVVLNDVVSAVKGPTATLSRYALDRLREQALRHCQKKARILLHGDPGNSLHEMLITHCDGSYIRPHINEYSAKSFLVLEGEMMVFFFDHRGGISDRYRLTPPQSGGDFMLRIQNPVFHTLVVMSEAVTFLETILGPHEQTRYASFAPDPNNETAIEYFAWLESESCRQQS